MLRRACLVLPALLFPSLAMAGSVERVPYQDSVWYACGPEEAVNLSGTFVRRVWESTDGNGVRHRHIVYALQGVKGVGSVTGDRYVATQNETSSQKYQVVEDGETVEVHTVLLIRLIRHGAGDDAWLRFFVDALYGSWSEDPLEERVRFEAGCSG